MDKFSKDGDYFKLYMKVFAFHKKHANAFTDEEWDAVATEIGQFTTPFEIDLAVALMNELEREYNATIGKGNDSV